MPDNGVLVTNRQARRDYFIMETLEAGIELQGSEIKSIRQRRASLKDSFARVEKSGVFLYNMHISPYRFSRTDQSDPKRTRRLLVRKSEIRHLSGKTREKGATLIPIRLYLKRGLAKLEIALAKGKKLYDKRQALKQKIAKREIDRVWKSRKR